METKKRKLYPYEKVLFGLKIFMAVVSAAFLIVYVIDEYRWAHCAAWMCLCVAQIANSCTRWDEQRKWNIFGICSSSVMLVLFGVLLVLSIV